jgi:hypothetical protein
LKVKYSPDFGAVFNSLPKQVQEKIKTVDRKLAVDDLSDFQPQGWAHFIDFDDEWSGMGRVKENGTLFYWLLLTSPELKAVIL